MEKQNFYYIVIDKLEKTIQLRQYEPSSCQARELKKVSIEYNVDLKYPMNIDKRFTLFHNDTKNYIDYSTFYKKYAKYKVLESKIEEV